MNYNFDKIISEVIEQINKDLNVDILKNNNSDIIGGNSPLDSLGVISFLLELENKIEDTYDLEITLVNDSVLNEEQSPLSNIKSLKSHLNTLIKS